MLIPNVGNHLPEQAYTLSHSITQEPYTFLLLLLLLLLLRH